MRVQRGEDMVKGLKSEGHEETQRKTYATGAHRRLMPSMWRTPDRTSGR